MAANQSRAPALMMGYWPTEIGNTGASNLSTAATWQAFSFIPDQAKTLSKFRAVLQTKNGTLTAPADLTCELYSNVNGLPGVSLEGPKSADSVPVSVPA